MAVSLTVCDTQDPLDGLGVGPIPSNKGSNMRIASNFTDLAVGQVVTFTNPWGNDGAAPITGKILEIDSERSIRVAGSDRGEDYSWIFEGYDGPGSRTWTI